MARRLLARFGCVCLIAVVVGVVSDASSALAGPPFGGGCGPRNCLAVWDPVQCANGVIYSNLCYAQRACATGCHAVTE